jgi:hypothetical protein
MAVLRKLGIANLKNMKPYLDDICYHHGAKSEFCNRKTKFTKPYYITAGLHEHRYTLVIIALARA